MLFSGGLVPWYIVCVELLHLRNNIWALFLPYTMNAWYVLIMRTFYKTNVPDSIIESAKIDGAGEYTIFFRIIISLAKPGLATIALFNTIVFWNDWWLPLMLVNDPKWFNLQYLMYRVQVNIQYLSSMAGNTERGGGDIEEASVANRADGHVHPFHRADRPGVPVLPEVFRQGDHDRLTERVGKTGSVGGSGAKYHKRRVFR